MSYIKNFEDITIENVGEVGGKNASLGEMITQLKDTNMRIPTGFAVTAAGYWHYIQENGLLGRLQAILRGVKLDADPGKTGADILKLQKAGQEARTLILQAEIPADMAQEIEQAYQKLCEKYGEQDLAVAVRSSATAEDLPTASFAGQHDSYLNVCGVPALLEACKKCIASLFTDRAIIYREQQGFDHFKVALSVGIQKMVRADNACAGVAFSLDTETGFKDVVMIESSYGVGESVVGGLVTPDQFVVHKPTFKQGFASLIKKRVGSKETKIVYNTQNNTQKQVSVPVQEQRIFSLTDPEIFELVRAVLAIENHYSDKAGHWVPMDVEWAKDAIDGKLYIVQARPETIHGHESNRSTGPSFTQYQLKSKPGAPLVTGQSIGQQIVSGTARIISDATQLDLVQKGDILVTHMTDPDWVPVMKRAAGIITQQGGRTCHAAIVSRELGIPAVVGAAQALSAIKDGQQITLDCSQGSAGFVYAGALEFETEQYSLDQKNMRVPVSVLVNIADPDSAFATSFLPVQGVGLARIEFVIANMIRVHPRALLARDKARDNKSAQADFVNQNSSMTGNKINENNEKKEDPDNQLAHDKKICDTIDTITAAYPDGATFFVDTLAQGIGMIAAAFYPRPVTVRFSDFKTNEYRDLIGGSYYEPQEENPMLGFRGASRYCHPDYKDIFALECAAMKKVRETMGLTNIKLMIPFVRTVGEAQAVLKEMGKNGLSREHGKGDTRNLEIIMMCEIPANVILIEQFSKLFDGFSIGSNDLTQLTLGVDRDSALLASLFDERDPAVQALCAQAIAGAHKQRRYIGICGQAPSDYPEFADFLIAQHIDSLSLNRDAVLGFLKKYAK